MSEASLEKAEIPDLLVLTCVEGPCKGASFQKRGTLLSVGRTNRSAICIKDPSVSEKHAKIIWDDGRWLLQDVGSSNGTKVNGSIVQADGDAVALNDQDVIHFGDAKLTTEVVPVPLETVAVEPYLWAECSRYETRVRAKCAQVANKLAEDWKAAKQDLLKELLTSS